MIMFVREQVEIKDEENECLRSQLQGTNKKLLQQAEDHEVDICVTCKFYWGSQLFVIVCQKYSIICCEWQI